VISGLVDVAGPDVLPLFKRDPATATEVLIRRVKTEDEYRWIADPAEGVALSANDVLLKRCEIERFEKQYGMANTQVTVAYKRPPGPGAPPRYYGANRSPNSDGEEVHAPSWEGNRIRPRS
jgi:hypothetical protein